MPARLFLLLGGERGDGGYVGCDVGEGAIVRYARGALDGHSAGGNGGRTFAATEVRARLFLRSSGVVDVLDEKREVDKDEVGSEVGLGEEHEAICRSRTSHEDTPEKGAGASRRIL